MLPYSSETLTLRGGLQVDTAIEALDAIGSATAISQAIVTLRNIQKRSAARKPDEPERISITFKGDAAGAARNDILMGLELLSSGGATTEQKIAAQALLDVMREQPT